MQKRPKTFFALLPSNLLATFDPTVFFTGRTFPRGNNNDFTQFFPFLRA